MSSIGDLEDKIHAKETLKQRIRQKEQCTTTDNINIYSLVRIPRCCTSLWLLALEHNIFTSPTKTACIVLAILVLFLYTLSPADDTSIVFMGCVFVHVIMIIAFAMIYEICSTRRARGRTSSTSVNHLIGCDTLHQYVPSSEAFPTRRRLQELRLQVALLDRELVEFENLTLSELPSASVFGIPSMNEEEINALPVHNYKGIGLESEDAPPEQGSFSAASTEEYWKIRITEEDPSCYKSTCDICLNQVIKGDLVHSLPCLHQFHSRCINPWLALNAACPICNIMLGSGARQSIESEISDDEMV